MQSLNRSIIKSYSSSLRYKLMGLFLAITLIPLIAINVLQLSYFKSSTVSMTQNTQNTIINENVNYINSWLTSKIDNLQKELQAQPKLRSGDKNAIVDTLNVIKDSDSNIEDVVLSDKNGDSFSEMGQEIKLSDRHYFVMAKQTKMPQISDVLISRGTGNKIIVIAVPALDDGGNFNGILLASIQTKTLENATKNIKIGDTGYGYLISDTGMILTYDNEDAVGKKYTEIIKDQNVAAYIKDNVLVNDRGNETYKDSNGNQIIVSYTKIPACNWKLVSRVPAKEVYKDYNNTFNLSILLILIIIILVVTLSVIVTKLFTKPISNLLDAMKKVAGNDLTVALEASSEDEVGQLSQKFNEMVSSQRSIVKEVLTLSQKVNNGTDGISSATEELTAASRNQSQTVEEFTATLEEMDTGIQDVTANISRLAENVSGVSTTIEEMGKSIQDTANNVEEAASAINQVSASIEQMGESIKGISEQSKQAQQEAGITVARAEEGNMAVGNTIHEMDRISQAVTNLSTAIKELGSSAERIGEIVNVIDDIAEQTNLLSLNAAIEAARAGDAGKGFAVVANSIRGLAERSGEATKDITKLIKGIQNEVKNAIEITKDSTERVKDGVQYVKGTGEVFEQIFEAINKTSSFINDISNLIEQQEQGSKEIVKATEKMADVVNQLSATAAEQAAGTEDIVQSVSNINDLTQQISATSEQQAASSQEIVKLIEGIARGTSEVSAGSEEISSTTGHLTSQAQELLNLVNSFKVK